MTTRVVLALLLTVFIGSLASAGSPHFVSCHVVGATADSITVAAKEAGLGDEAQIEAEFTATALCINGGGHHPKAVNKADVAAAGTFPVQNGMTNYTLTGVAVFQPPCSPPMTVSFTDMLITDLTNGLTCVP